MPCLQYSFLARDLSKSLALIVRVNTLVFLQRPQVTRDLSARASTAFLPQAIVL